MFHQKLAGIVKEIKILHSDGTETVVKPFKNLIHNSGLDRIATSDVSDSTKYCSASSDSLAPVATDNSILNKVGSTAVASAVTSFNSGGVPSWFFSLEKTYTFPLGGVVGNISKLYFHSSSSGGVIFSSALIKDEFGNPTTITVTAEDQLIVTWCVEKHFDTAPVTGTIDIEIEGVITPIAYEIKFANLGNSSAAYFYASAKCGPYPNAYAYETDSLGAETSRPSGSLDTLTFTQLSYVNGNYYMDFTLSAGLSVANFPTGIGAIAYNGSSSTSGTSYQISFNPKLPKTSDKTLSLPFRVSWGRL